MTDAADDDEGKVVWPIPEEGISYLDAATTLFDISEATFGLSHYAENGNDMLGDLALSLFGPYNCYFQKPLKQALEEQLDEPSDFSILDEMECTDWFQIRPDDEKNAAREKSERLVVRLLRAYHEWETNEATWTWDELRARPLPPMTP